MKGFVVSVSIYGYRWGHTTQKIVDDFARYYRPVDGECFVRKYSNGLITGIKVRLYCEDTFVVGENIRTIGINIYSVLHRSVEKYDLSNTKVFLPTIKININDNLIFEK